MAVGTGAVIAIGGLGAGYVLLKKDGTAADGAREEQPKSSPTPGGTSLQDRLMAQRGYDYGLSGGRLAHPYIDGGRKALTSVEMALREAEKQIKAEYEAMSAELRAKAAKELNDKLGTSLTGDESFEDLTAIAGAALGASAAAAGCAAVGAGALSTYCGALGAIAGAYLGRALGEYIGDAYDHVEDWASDQWDKVEDGWDDVGNYLGLW